MVRLFGGVIRKFVVFMENICARDNGIPDIRVYAVVRRKLMEIDGVHRTCQSFSFTVYRCTSALASVL